MILGEVYTESFAARVEKIRASYAKGKLPVFMVNNAREYDIIEDMRKQKGFYINIPTEMMLKSSNEYSYPLFIATFLGGDDDYEDYDDDDCDYDNDSYCILKAPKTLTVYSLEEFTKSTFALHMLMTKDKYDILIEDEEILKHMNNIAEQAYDLPF